MIIGLDDQDFDDLQIYQEFIMIYINKKNGMSSKYL